MTEIEAFPVETPHRFYFQWVLPIFWRPRQTLTRIIEQNGSTWLTPMLVLTLLALVSVFVAAPVRQSTALAGTPALPADFQYWSPEQQAQYQQANAASSGPMFIFGFPIITALVSVWLGWWLFSGILHLVLTLSGSRTGMGGVLNVVAWASLPFGLRSVVQAVAMLSTNQLIQSPGLSGFAPTAVGIWSNLAGALLALIDIYLIWQVILIMVGLRPLSGFTKKRIATTVLISLALLLALEALPRFLGAQFGGLSIVRPFFF